MRLCAIAGLTVGLSTGTPAIVHAKNNKAAIVGREPWAGQRVVMLLPLQLGEAWNADRTSGSLLLGPAQEQLVRLLENTGKFSVVTPHRFNPVLMRAVQDKLITRTELLDLEHNPTVDQARQVMSKITFSQVPLIAAFTLEEIRGSSANQRGAVQVQVLGRLYDINNSVALKTVAVTSDPVPTRGRQTVLDTAVQATVNALAQVVPQFIEPLPDISFAPVQAAPATVGGTTPGIGTTPVLPPAQPPVEEGPNDLSLRGSSSTIPPVAIPQLPAPAPPLGVGVPDAPTVGR